MNSDPNRLEFQTKPWQRSPNSMASTIPQQILAIKGAPVQSDDFRCKWSINPETGVVEVRFVEIEGDDDDE